MTMRISTAFMHQQALGALNTRQQKLWELQQQMTTGNKLSTASVDPAAAAQAQRLDHAVATLEHYGRSAALLDNRLSQQEEALRDGGDVLTRARELAVQAGNAPLSNEDRRAIALEIRELREQLIAIGNRHDGNGRSLFAGQRDGVTPFVANGGAVTYHGDDGQNQVEVAPDLALADTEPGSAVFMRVRTGDGQLQATARSTNTGSLVMQRATVTDTAAWPREALRLEFTDATNYRVLRPDNSVLTAGTYTPGDTLNFAGMQVRLDGTPEAGDTVDLQPATNRDVFATLDLMADALEAPVASVNERARLSNAINGALTDISTAQEHFLAQRAASGARLSALQASADTRESEGISLKTSLSQLRDVDYAQAASELSLHLTALEAAQQTMLRVKQLSLFSKL